MRDSEPRWLKMLKEALKDVEWQPPEELPVPEPKEPPERIKKSLKRAIDNLNEELKEAIWGRFVLGMSIEQTAEWVGGNSLYAKILDKGATEAIARELKADEMEVRAWLAWWGKTVGKEIEEKVEKSPHITLERMYVGMLRNDFTGNEKKHLRRCKICKDSFRKLKGHVWHPSAMQLWRFAIASSRLPENERVDINYHLFEDKCQRCSLIFNALMPLAGMATLEPELTAVFRMPRTAHYDLLFFESPALRFHPPSYEPKPIVMATYEPRELSAKSRDEGKRRIEVSEKNASAELSWDREKKAWVASARADKEFAGYKAHFFWITLDGEVTKSEAKLGQVDRSAVGEAEMSQSKRLKCGYFVVAILPPRFLDLNIRG